MVMLSYATPTQKKWVTLMCISACECEWAYFYVLFFFWEGVSVFELQYVSVNVSLCISLGLSWLPTQSALLWGCQKPSLMKGLVYGRSEYWTVLQQTAESGETGRLSSRTSTADSENVWGGGAQGKSGWVSAGGQNIAPVMEYHPFNYRKILMMSLYGAINPQINMAWH